MVGIVVVSHSRSLARAAVGLAQEMVHGQPVRMRVAAGLDEHTLGTDAVQIMNAILAADDGQGVVVLMDLGSAVLSTELALDLLDADARGRVLLCAGPVVEGLVAAAVAAAGGADRHEVCTEASASLAGKQSHLGVAGPEARAVSAPEESPGDRVVGTFTVTNQHGLHARPAARLVQEVRTLDATVHLRNLTTGARPVPASSLSKVATLGALREHQVEVSVSGSQAREGLERVLALARRSFDEPPGAVGPPPAPGGGLPVYLDSGEVSHLGRGPGGGPRSDSPVAPVPILPGQVVRGLPAAAGIGVGPVWHLRTGVLEVPDSRAEDPKAEWRRVREALAEVRRQVQRLRARTAREVGEQDAAIFDAHLLLLEDTDLLGDVRARIEAGQAGAPAWAAAVARVEAEIAAISDPYLQARAADIRAIGDQVLQVLLGVSTSAATGQGVLVARDLTAGEAAELDAGRVTGVVLAQGSPTAHGAILARAKGIPAVVGAGPAVLDLPEGTVLAVDARAGEVVVDPGEQVLARFVERAGALARARQAALVHAAAPAMTRDGVHVLVGANLASVDDARMAAASGADLAGLVRTEFLFLGRDQPPDMEEQEKTYLALAEELGGRRITLRTLDVGGDKPLEYVRMRPEANPFLGVRGLRLSLARPGLLVDQMLAVVRVAHATPVSLMFPMVSQVTELVQARRLLDEAVAVEGRGQPSGLQVGIMVEVPAAALKSAAFAAYVDFFSIGTNDLTQYALAAERGNDAVAAIGDPYDPGVLSLVDSVCRGSGGKLVAVCGELAADELAVGVLIGLGVRELSVSPGAVPPVKQAVRSVLIDQAAATAARALRADGPQAVRALLGRPG